MKPKELRRRRRALALSQDALAREVGVTMQVVSYWERGVWGMSPANEAKLREVLAVHERREK